MVLTHYSNIVKEWKIPLAFLFCFVLFFCWNLQPQNKKVHVFQQYCGQKNVLFVFIQGPRESVSYLSFHKILKSQTINMYPHVGRVPVFHSRALFLCASAGAVTKRLFIKYTRCFPDCLLIFLFCPLIILGQSTCLVTEDSGNTPQEFVWFCSSQCYQIFSHVKLLVG